jgi:TolA-binding protein/outer membrane protein assembly factor BamB
MEDSARESGKKSVLAVTNPSGILVYNHLDAERARVEALPPDDTESLLQRAKFHLKNSEIESGLAALRSWLDSDAPAPQPNSRLDHLHLDLAEMIQQLLGAGEAEEHSEELLRYRTHLEATSRRKVEAAIALANKLEADGKPGQALVALHQALAFDDAATDYSPDGLLTVASATYVRERILDLRKKTPNPEQTFLAVDAAAQEALQSAQLKTTTALLEVIRRYPFTPAVATAYLDVSLRFRDSKSYDQAIKALDGYIADYPQGNNVITAKLLVANLLYQSGRGLQARACYLDLLEQDATRLAAGAPGTRKGETVEEYVRPLIGDPGLREEVVEEYRTLRFPIQMKWRSPADLQALKRTFLFPTGVPPDRLENCFITQSEDTLELRDAETGLPVWKVYLEMIPGFEFEPYPFGNSFRYPHPRLGKRAFSARFVKTPTKGAPNDPATLLVLRDTRNILAVDALKGTVRWHVPIGPEREAKDPTRPQRPQLREKLRGVAITPAGAFATTTRNRLRHYNAQGELVWETELTYTPASHEPIVLGGKVFVHARPLGLHVHDAITGEEKADQKLGAAEGLDELKLPPITLVGSDPESPSGRVLLASPEELKLLDLETRTLLWTFSQPGKHREILEVAYDHEFPDECIVFVNRVNNWPAMVAVSLDDGNELWRYEKFPAAKAKFSVVRDRNKFYATRTRKDRSYLVAVQVRSDVETLKPIVQALWPTEVTLMGRHGRQRQQGRLCVGGDSVFYTHHGNVFVYDKLQGVSRTAPASMIDKFLVEKKECSTAVIHDKLILLTDGGDCAFGPQGGSTSAMTVFSPDAHRDASRPSPFKGRDGAEEIALLQSYHENPGALESTARLALQYFRDGELGSAIRLLNQALVSEDLLLEKGTEKRFLLGYLLDGIKEEYMKRRVPKIKAHRFRQAPAIDGELNDAWDVASRIHLSAPNNLGTIPGPGQLRDWEGEEDLSAVLYTGWDGTYFYFALDVTDDVLYPYDRDAENWRGDCLLIGLDPTGDGGYKQRGNDQLMTLALTVPKRNKLDKEEDEEGEEGKDEEEKDDDKDEKKPEGLFSVRKKDDNSGAIYEVALPWSSFSPSYEDGAEPPPGFAFGLSLLLTDDDTGQGATKTLSINPCHLLPRNQKNSPVWRFIIPYFFPRVTLE